MSRSVARSNPIFDELARFLASRKLEKGALYDASLDQQLAYCGSRLIRMWTRAGAYPLTPEGSRQTDPEDIVTEASGIVLGQGWFPVERYKPGQRFRWIQDDAELTARVPPDSATLRLEVEPGPGFAKLPARLEVVDETGTVVAAWQVRGRAVLELMIPASRDGAPRRFRLRVPGGGRPVAHDLGILNFRVFECAWVERPQPARTDEQPPELPRLRANPLVRYRAARLWKKRGTDVFESGGGYRTGEGWRPGTAACRVLTGEAQLAGPVTHPRFKLALLGEAASSAQTTVIIRSAGDAVLGWKKVNTLVLAAAGGPVKVLACGSRHANRGQAVADSWNALTISTQPRETGWFASPAEQQLIAEMDSPAFLHTQACGDFTMMAREHWLNVRGYAELDMYSLHLDSLLCYAADHAGAREVILRDPMRIYHIQHSSRSGYTPGLRRFHAPMIVNAENWGLGDLTFAETEPAAAMENVR